MPNSRRCAATNVFPNNPPTSTAVQVAGLLLGARIEIDAVAFIAKGCDTQVVRDSPSPREPMTTKAAIETPIKRKEAPEAQENRETGPLPIADRLVLENMR